jgi:hypothetical protein
VPLRGKSTHTQKHLQTFHRQKRLANKDPVDPPANEESECEQASQLVDNLISTQLILRMNSHSATIRACNTTQAAVEEIFKSERTKYA